MQKITQSIIKKLYYPSPTSHKGANGRLLIIAGSDKYHGSVVLCASMASKMVDMVYLATTKDNFDIIKKARDYFGGIIMANGGINSLDDGIQVLKKTRADGLGIARGALGCPWIFQELKNIKKENKIPEKIFEIALRHAELAESLKGQQGIIEIRKHLCWYVHGIIGASEMRRELINVSSLNEIKNIFNSFGFVV